MVTWKQPDWSLETSEKYHAADFMPLSMPDSLDELKGTDDMVFTLPVTVYWGPRRKPFDMRVPADVIRAYSELISHAGKERQCELMNKELLQRYWPDLFLDNRRVRPLWESHFPELKSHHFSARI